MAKIKFNKNSIMDTVVNVGTGGAANARVDVAVEYVAPNASDMYVNIGKFVGGVVLGSTMGNNKMFRAAADGIATVGVANLVKSLISDGFGGSEEGTAGFKRNVILDGSDGSHHRVELKVLMHLSLLTHSGSVHKHELVSEFIIKCCDRVSCSTCDRSHDVPFLAEQGICERRFAYVRLSDDGEMRKVRTFVLVRIFGREFLHDSVKKVTCTTTVGSGNAVDLSESE